MSNSDEENSVIQKLLQLSEIEQTNKQKILIENSTNIEVTTIDNDIVVNLQVSLQILVAIEEHKQTGFILKCNYNKNLSCIL